MKERSLAERIVAILGVLIGSVGWVVRLLVSLVQGIAKDALGRGDSQKQDAQGRQDSGAGAAGRADQAAPLDNLATMNVSTTRNVRNGDTMQTPTDEDDARGERSVSEDIPYIEERGDERDTPYGSEDASVSDTDSPVSDYAGQVQSESDIGVARGDQIQDLASSPDNDLEGGVDTYDIRDASETGSDEDVQELEDDVPSASRGWHEDANDPLAGDPLYGDVESSEAGEEIDLRNDEMSDDMNAGMHVVESPDEPFIEEDLGAQEFGFADASDDSAFDAAVRDQPEIDDVTNLETPAVDENMFASDALGNRIGGDPASGDLGGETSYDDAQRPPGESREPGDTIGAIDTSGVDEFEDDTVAADMLEDVRSDGGAGSNGPAANNNAAESAAWASSAGVVDKDLTQPAGTEDLEGGPSQTDAERTTDAGDDRGEPGSGEQVYDDFSVKGSPSEAVKAPMYDPEDASLRDVAAEIAEDIDTDDFSSGRPDDAGRDTRVDARQRPGPAGSVRGDGTASCPADYPIKGNARSRIYHLPADSSYEGTVPDFCFATEEDAQTAGFRPRKA